MNKKHLILLSLLVVVVFAVAFFMQKQQSTPAVVSPEPTRVPAPLTRTEPFIPWAPESVVFTTAASPVIPASMSTYQFPADQTFSPNDLSRVARLFSFTSQPIIKNGASGFVARWNDRRSGSLNVSLDASGRRAAYSRYKSATTVVGPVRSVGEAAAFAISLMTIPQDVIVSADKSSISSLQGISVGKDVVPPYTLYKITAQLNSYPLFSSSFSETLSEIVTDSQGVVLSVKTDFPPAILSKGADVKPISTTEAAAGLNAKRGILVSYESGTNQYETEKPSFSSVAIDTWKLGYYASAGVVYPAFLAQGSAEENGKLVTVTYFINALAQ